MIDDTVEIMKLMVQAKGLFLEYDIDNQVPQKIYADKKRLKQVLLNLISNALKFTVTGGIIITISIEGRGSDI